MYVHVFLTLSLFKPNKKPRKFIKTSFPNHIGSSPIWLTLKVFYNKTKIVDNCQKDAKTATRKLLHRKLIFSCYFLETRIKRHVAYYITGALQLKQQFTMENWPLIINSYEAEHNAPLNYNLFWLELNAFLSTESKINRHYITKEVLTDNHMWCVCSLYSNVQLYVYLCAYVDVYTHV